MYCDQVITGIFIWDTSGPLFLKNNGPGLKWGGQRFPHMWPLMRKRTLTAFRLQAVCQPLEWLCYPLARNINLLEQLRRPFVRNIKLFKRLGDLFIRNIKPFERLVDPFVRNIKPFKRLGHPFVKDNRPFEWLGHPYYGIPRRYFFCWSGHGRWVTRWATFAKYKCRSDTCSKYFTCSSGQLIQCLKDLFDFISTSFSAVNCYFGLNKNTRIHKRCGRLGATKSFSASTIPYQTKNLIRRYPI